MGYESAVEVEVAELRREGVADILSITPTATHGNKVRFDPGAWVEVFNGSGSPITVTVHVSRTIDDQTVTDRAISIDAGARKKIGPFANDYRQADGWVWLTFSAVTSVTMAAFRVRRYVYDPYGTYRNRLLSIAPASLIGLWPLDEASGTAANDLSAKANHAVYGGGAGVTLAVPGIGDGNTAAEFDGNNTYVQICRTAFTTFETDWNGNLYSLVTWGRVDDAERWLDATTYRYLAHIRAADSTYYTVTGKSQTNHQLEWRRRSGGLNVAITHNFNPTGPLDWFCMGLTFDQSKPLLTAYLWSSPTGFIEVGSSNNAALTDWGTNPPTDGTAVLMAGSITAQEWIGRGAYGAIWDAELTLPQMRQAMTP